MYARKVDANHKQIAEAFERLGCKVHHTIGDWDLTICKHDVVRLIEVKDPSSPNLKRRNKGNELIDSGWPIIRVMTVDDVVEVVKGMI